MTTTRPIIFNGAMVRALLDGSKTQTRRIVKPTMTVPRVPPRTMEPWMIDGEQETDDNGYPCWAGYHPDYPGDAKWFSCPYGGVEDRLWVRETFAIESNFAIETEDRYPPPFNDGRPIVWTEGEGERYWQQCHYRATDPAPELAYHDRDAPGVCWHPSVHMPRALSRITLEITAVRVERLQDISECDARAEGCGAVCDYAGHCNSGRCAARHYRKGYALLWDSINGAGAWAANPWVWALTFTRVAR